MHAIQHIVLSLARDAQAQSSTLAGDIRCARLPSLHISDVMRLGALLKAPFMHRKLPPSKDFL